MTKRTILVTGGAGYIGSITVKKLLDQSFDVVVLDNLENGHREAVDKRVRAIEIVDLANKKDIAKVFEKYEFDAVIDFAAYLAVGESMQEPIKYLKNNVFNFVNLLDVMAEKGCDKIVKSSTAAVYGEPLNESDLPLAEDYIDKFKPTESCLLSGKIDGVGLVGEAFFAEIIGRYQKYFSDRPELLLDDEEMEKLRIPTSVYGLTKMMDEILLGKYEKLWKIKHVILRYFNVAGADPSGEIGEDHPVETHIIPLLIKSVLSGKQFTVFGQDYPTADGTAIRDYIDVNDLAIGHLLASKYLIDARESNKFNLGTGEGYSVKQIVSSVERNINEKIDIVYGERRSGDPTTLISSPLKANDILNWQVSRTLKDMIESAWKWHSTHPNGYEDKT